MSADRSSPEEVNSRVREPTASPSATQCDNRAVTTSMDSSATTPSTAPRSAAVRSAPSAAATSRAVIDLEAVAHNGRRLAQVAGVPWMAVVKADAYGPVS